MGWLLPVGTPGGITSGLDGVPDGCGIVKFGNKWASLDADHYRVWRTAAAAPQLEDLLSWATTKGIPDAADRVHELEDAELLIQEAPNVAELIGELALRLIGECLGNGAGLSPIFLVAGRRGTKVQVDAHLFELLLHCDGVNPLATTCGALDGERSEPGYRPRIETLTTWLPVLIRNEVVLLEAAAT